ncbi:gamma-type small acid-soluble spore protein [Mesobacillus maritimus]|uniref:gamma-type small acid-soluble spore protein n=1 Tax=Mesobacillus maritimus TaxID=1643336 RepID=UPI00203AB195|nr:gamma-type small acid-soluble spore protein [Mesobacillus maritimus]MCM3585694.1 gamma-type small acid-soluble spore protein [Mesobacillus maritimus]MCM3669166.1 gamma-type small acid-soluble spore protein [Mesobacillus maritimus]
MANRQNQTQSGTNIQQVRQQNAQASQGGAAGAGQFGTEFASETNAQQVREQNARASRAGGAATAKSGQGQYATEFGLESQTNAQEVRRQNQQAEAKKSQNAGGQFGQQ